MELADFRLLKNIRYGMTQIFSDILQLDYSSLKPLSSRFQNLDSRLASAGVFEELRNSAPYNALQHAVEISSTDARAAGMEVHRNAGLMMTTLHALSKKIRPPISEAERTRVSDALKKYSMFLGEFYKDANSFGSYGGSRAVDLWFGAGKRHHNRFYEVANELRNVTSGIGYEMEILAVLDGLWLEEDEFVSAKENIQKVCKFPMLAEKVMPSIRGEYNIGDGWDETDEVSQLKEELSKAHTKIRDIGTQLEQVVSRQALVLVPKNEAAFENLVVLQKKLSEEMGLNRPALDLSITMTAIARRLETVLLPEDEGLNDRKRNLLKRTYGLEDLLNGVKGDDVLDANNMGLARSYDAELLKFLNSELLA